MADDKEPQQPIPRTEQPWVVKVPTDTFHQIKNDSEFCALVTLARAVNALHFVLAPLLDLGLGDSPKVIRARYNSLAFSCALFAEVVPLVEGMQRYFKTHPIFQRLASIIHSKEAKELRKGNLAVRNKLVFHFDASEVREQMKTLERENPIFTSGLGPIRLNVHNELADLVTLRTLFGPDFPKDLKDIQSRVQTVARVVVSFLIAADEFIVTVMTERKWAEMQLSVIEPKSSETITSDRFEIYLSRSAEVTAEEINALPEKLRRYIHDLATRSDPAGDIRTIASLTEQRDALVLRVRELERQL